MTKRKPFEQAIPCHNEAGCPGVACGDRACWMREGWRLSIEAVKEAVHEDGVPGWLPDRLCDVASFLVPDWEWAGPDYLPQTEHHAAVGRGEVWTATGGAYLGKPRPVVVIQDVAFGAIGSVTVCPITTLFTDAAGVRVAVESTTQNGLKQPGFVMVDKIMTVPRAKVHRRLGTLSTEIMSRIDKALLTYLFEAR